MSGPSFVATFLFNALWQLPLLFGAAWAGARLLARAPAAYRHRLWVAALALCLVVPLVGTVRPSKLDVARIVADARWSVLPAAAAAGTRVAARPVAPASGSRLARTALQAIAPGYLVLVLGLTLRLFSSWRATRRLALESRPAPPALAAVAEELGASGMLRVSDAVAAPMTFGVADPVIVLPGSFARSAGREALRGVLAHELAHVRRRDCALHLLCELLALPLAFHPTVRAMRRRIAGARETACDEAAASVVDRGAYAATLLDVAAAAARRPRLAGAVGVLDGDSLEDRMERVLDPRTPLRHRRALLAFALSVVTLGLVGRAAAGAALQVAADPGPDDMVGVWKGEWAEGDHAGKPAAGIEILLTPNGPAIDLVLYRYEIGSAEPPQLERPPVVSHRIEKGVLYFKTRARLKASGGPGEILEADWEFSVVGKDAGQLRARIGKFVDAKSRGEAVPPPPPPLAMKRVRS